MATRFYYTTTTSPLTPEFPAEWDLTDDVATFMLSRTPTRSASGNYLLTKGSTDMLNKDRLVRQFVSPSLVTGTLIGTVKGRVLAAESAAGNQLRSMMLIQVWDGACTKVRGTLYAGDLTNLLGDPVSEWALTTLTNRQMPRGASVAVTPVAAKDGDRLVITVGYRVHTNSTSNFNGTIRFGDDGTADLPENETTTTQTLRPWIEFSDTMLFNNTRCRNLVEQAS